MNSISPRLFSLYKPPGITSYDVIRKIKRIIPKAWGKIGHFGTLDPFAEGLLIVGVAGAARLNDYIHSETTKTYIAKGILGKKTPTGDLTVEVSEVDDSKYLNEVISSFSIDFLQKELETKFEGEYMQAPPAYSAAKFEGKPLHEWARQGIEIKKEPKKRHIYRIKAVEYSFPELIIEAEVSSGTYIRTLFEDCAKHLGTFGVLKNLTRSQIGLMNSGSTIHFDSLDGMGPELLIEKSLGPEEVLNFPKIELKDSFAQKFSNGMELELEGDDGFKWVFSAQRILGLAKQNNGHLKGEVIFPNLNNA